jgi:hypothetical protein
VKVKVVVITKCVAIATVLRTSQDTDGVDDVD